MAQFLTVQATRSFNEYIQGASYLINPADETMMTLLGAGYFHETHNPNLRIEAYAESGELMIIEPDPAGEEQADGALGTQPDGDSTNRDTRRSAARRSGSSRNRQHR